MTLTWQTFNFGSYTNIGDADDLKTAFTKTDNNLNYLKERLNTFDNTNNSSNTLLVMDGYNVRIKTIETSNENSTITSTNDSIIIDVKDSINSLYEDNNPRLSSNLNVNDFEIFNKDVFDEYKNLKLNELLISTTNGYTTLYSENPISLVSDGIIKVGSDIAATGKTIQCGTVNTNSLTATNIIASIISDESGNPVSIIGNILGDLTGITTGTHIGNVTGNVSDISNHSIKDLNDVSYSTPIIDQIFVWDGTEYVPTTLNELTSKAPVRLPKLTTVQINMLVPVEGDMLYNITTKKFQGYSDGAWVDLH